MCVLVFLANLVLYILSFLGMPFNQAVDILRSQDRLIKDVQVFSRDEVKLSSTLSSFKAVVHFILSSHL